MTWLIFFGDMFVMAFMIVVVAWLALASDDAELEAAARLPLDDESDTDGGGTAQSDGPPEGDRHG